MAGYPSHCDGFWPVLATATHGPAEMTLVDPPPNLVHVDVTMRVGTVPGPQWHYAALHAKDVPTFVSIDKHQV